MWSARFLVGWSLKGQTANPTDELNILSVHGVDLFEGVG
jgi:hypothetical protein